MVGQRFLRDASFNYDMEKVRLDSLKLGLTVEENEIKAALQADRQGGRSTEQPPCRRHDAGRRFDHNDASASRCSGHVTGI
jgi:hypothetical protein